MRGGGEGQVVADGRCTAAYRKTFGSDLDTDRQARLVRPLAFGLLDKEQTMYARQRLLQALDHYHWRLGTGFLSTPLILSVLGTIDIEAAYHLLENEKMPGWLFMPKSGATVYTVTIPANGTATVVTGGKKHTLGAGTYRLTPA